MTVYGTVGKTPDGVLYYVLSEKQKFTDTISAELDKIQDITPPECDHPLSFVGFAKDTFFCRQCNKVVKPVAGFALA